MAVKSKQENEAVTKRSRLRKKEILEKRGCVRTCLHGPSGSSAWEEKQSRAEVERKERNYKNRNVRLKAEKRK